VVFCATMPFSLALIGTGISEERAAFIYHVGSIPNEVIGFFNSPNLSSRTMALVSPQPLTEMSTRNLPGGQEQPARMSDRLTAMCEPTV
jgi:hypothetical protein